MVETFCFNCKNWNSKRFAHGGMIQKPDNDSIPVVFERGWWKCKKCGVIFEDFVRPPIHHTCTVSVVDPVVIELKQGVESFSFDGTHSLKKATDSLKILSNVFHSINTQSMSSFSDGLVELWFEEAKTVYRRECGKLPGSKKTKRLRKKQRDYVLKYFHSYLAGGLLR